MVPGMAPGIVPGMAPGIGGAPAVCACGWEAAAVAPLGVVGVCGSELPSAGTVFKYAVTILPC